jgi:hypothetical protein
VTKRVERDGCARWIPTREGGPSILFPTGTTEWTYPVRMRGTYGIPDRRGAPAVLRADGGQAWWQRMTITRHVLPGGE